MKFVCEIELQDFQRGTDLHSIFNQLVRSDRALQSGDAKQIRDNDCRLIGSWKVIDTP